MATLVITDYSPSDVITYRTEDYYSLPAGELEYREAVNYARNAETVDSKVEYNNSDLKQTTLVFEDRRSMIIQLFF